MSSSASSQPSSPLRSVTEPSELEDEPVNCVTGTVVDMTSDLPKNSDDSNNADQKLSMNAQKFLTYNLCVMAPKKNIPMAGSFAFRPHAHRHPRQCPAVVTWDCFIDKDMISGEKRNRRNAKPPNPPNPPNETLALHRLE